MIFKAFIALMMVVLAAATALPDTLNLEKRQNCKALGVRTQKLNTTVETLIIMLRTLDYAWLTPIPPALPSVSPAIAPAPRPTSNAASLWVASLPRVMESVRTLAKVY